MNDHAREQEILRVDEAMNRVLAAEREAREAVETCRGEAAAVLRRAEETAAAIGRRAERRVRAAHQIADAAVERALAALAGTRPAGGETAPAAAQVEAVGRAVAALVEEIVGGAR